MIPVAVYEMSVCNLRKQDIEELDRSIKANNKIWNNKIWKEKTAIKKEADKSMRRVREEVRFEIGYVQINVERYDKWNKWKIV